MLGRDMPETQFCVCIHTNLRELSCKVQTRVYTGCVEPVGLQYIDQLSALIATRWGEGWRLDFVGWRLDFVHSIPEGILEVEQERWLHCHNQRL